MARQRELPRSTSRSPRNRTCWRAIRRPFRHPLLAIAPQPGAPGGRALQPGARGRRRRRGRALRARRRLAAGKPAEHRRRATDAAAARRGVADARSRHTPSGTAGQMWLWRGETGLWEKDPATPRELSRRPARHRLRPRRRQPRLCGRPRWRAAALRQDVDAGTDLRSRRLRALPAAGSRRRELHLGGLRGLGSDRRLPACRTSRSPGGRALNYTGGLLVNNGSGWQIDLAPRPRAGQPKRGHPVGGGRRCPTAARRCPRRAAADVPHVFERNSAGARLGSDPAPYPGYRAPGSLALFREGGALRVIGSGARARHGARRRTDAAAGRLSRPPLIRPYPLAQAPAVHVPPDRQPGGAKRNTTTMKSGPPVGSYKLYDKGYEPDPSWAVLVSIQPARRLGGRRFPAGQIGRRASKPPTSRATPTPTAESTPPPGVGSAPVPVEPGAARSRSAAARSVARRAPPAPTRASAPTSGCRPRSSGRARSRACATSSTPGRGVTTGATSVKATVEITLRSKSSPATRNCSTPAPRFRSTPPPRRPTASGGSECLFQANFPQLLRSGERAVRIGPGRLLRLLRRRPGWNGSGDRARRQQLGRR